MPETIQEGRRKGAYKSRLGATRAMSRIIQGKKERRL